MPSLKDFVKPPFANYDIVVYFGAGLFSVPFIYRYIIEPLGVPQPQFLLVQTDQVVLEIIRVLMIVTFVYVLGHLIAYFSSQLVEKALDRFFGKISTAILVSAQSDKKNRNEKIRDFFKSRSKEIRKDNAIFSSLVRGAFHFPNFLHYAVVYIMGIFGYFDSRIPPHALLKAEEVYKEQIVDQSIATDVKWFKCLEYFVINRIPTAVPRMYNYLVIAGLFRSLSFIFLASAWWLAFYMSTYLVFGTWPLGESQQLHAAGMGVIELIALASCSVFCLMAYIKFQRRYAEEAILALAFWCKEG